jgi:Centromere DNA-binding protein complex CBF3 subunit, domain 2
MPLIFTTRAGKQNQHGRFKTIRALQNKKPLICMLSGVVFYLLYRWDVSDELFLDFSKRSAWYNIRLIKSSTGGREAAFSYNLQQEWIAKVF